MKTVSREEANEIWEQWWSEAKEEWFKVEVLQDYTGEDKSESLDAWRAGDKQRSIQRMPELMNEWIAMCQKSLLSKKRIHVVEKPYTPYLEWEITLYKNVNIPLCGEKILLVPKEKISHMNIPDGDFNIFDSQKVIKHRYTAEGFAEKADVYEKGEDIRQFLELREELVRCAILIEVQ